MYIRTLRPYNDGQPILGVITVLGPVAISRPGIQDIILIEDLTDPRIVPAYFHFMVQLITPVKTLIPDPSNYNLHLTLNGFEMVAGITGDDWGFLHNNISDLRGILAADTVRLTTGDRDGLQEAIRAYCQGLMD